MVAAANGVGGDGCVRVRAREKEQRGGASRKSERGPRGLRGIAGGNQGRRRQPGREEVAGAASALATELLRCEGRKTTGGKAAVGWAAGGAGPAGLPGEQQVGLLLFLNFSSVLFNLLPFSTVSK